MRSTMARNTICMLWISVICASGIGLAETSGPDLEPEEGVFGSRISPYKDAVAAILLGRNEYGGRECQMVFLPSFGPESAVYILRSDDGKETKQQ